jgi:hypothetical protein
MRASTFSCCNVDDGGENRRTGPTYAELTGVGAEIECESVPPGEAAHFVLAPQLFAVRQLRTKP